MTERSRRCGISRRMLLQAPAAIAAAAIADRGADANSTRPRFAARQAERVELTFAATEGDVAKIQPLLDEYAHAAQLTIRTVASPYDDLYAKLNVNMTQATGAFDVVSVDDPWMPLFAGGEFLRDIGEMLDKLAIPPDQDLIPSLAALGVFPPESGIRAIPWVGNIQMFVWRTDVLSEMQREVPQTWDDVLSLAMEVTETHGASGLFGIGIRGVPGHPASTSFLPVLRGFGLDMLDPETNEPQFSLARAIQAIDLHLQLAKVAPGGVDQAGHDDITHGLSSGRIALSPDIWPDQLMQASDPDQSRVADRIAVGPEPSQWGTRTPHVTGCWLLGIPRESRSPDAALDLILWLTDREQQKRLAMSRLVPPTRLSVLNDPEVAEALPFVGAILDAAQHAAPRPRSPHLPSIEQILGRYLADGILGHLTANEVAYGANEEIRELLVREGVLD